VDFFFFLRSPPVKKATPSNCGESIKQKTTKFHGRNTMMAKGKMTLGKVKTVFDDTIGNPQPSP
jgi:hypothetical protein